MLYLNIVKYWCFAKFRHTKHRIDNDFYVFNDIELRNENKMKELDDEIREIYEALETLNEGKKEKFDIFSRDEDILVEELEKLKFSYFKKGFLACLLHADENLVSK